MCRAYVKWTLDPIPGVIQHSIYPTNALKPLYDQMEKDLLPTDNVDTDSWTTGIKASYYDKRTY